MMLSDVQGLGTIVNDDASPLVINDITVTEGNSGTTSATFTVSMASAWTAPVSVDWATFDSTATAGADYEAASGSLTFNPGETAKTITVLVTGDTLDEMNEQFRVTLSGVVGSTIYDAHGYATITDNDLPPQVSIGPATVTEGAFSNTVVAVPLTLSTVSGQLVTVTYTTFAGSATAGSDYTTTSGTVSSRPGRSTATVYISVLADSLDENDETFRVDLSNAVNATLGTASGTVTIIDNTEPPSVQVGNATLNEGQTSSSTASFSVVLSGPSAKTITVGWATEDGTATAGSDYTASSGTLIFAPGETLKTVTVPVVGDRVIESNETFFVQLTAVSNVTLSPNNRGTGTITNDDNPPVANAGPDRTTNEGTAITFSSSGSSDLNGYPLSYAWDFGDGTTGTGAAPVKVYQDNGVYTVTLTVSNGTGVTSTDTAIVTVNNVAPTAIFTANQGALRGQVQNYTFRATDPALADLTSPFTYAITWEDGTTQTLTGGATITVARTYAVAGSYPISFTVTDKDGATSAATNGTIAITAARLNMGMLYVAGTDGADHIVLRPGAGVGQVQVSIDGVDVGTFTTGMAAAMDTAVYVYGRDGDDTVEVLATQLDGTPKPFNHALLIFGDGGNDILNAAASSALAALIGGAGNDQLTGGSNRDFLVGGLGADILRGGGGDDLLIGGSTIFDQDEQALGGMATEWWRTDADAETRRGRLTGTLTGGYNGSAVLTAATVEDDGAADDLFGELGDDWFVIRVGPVEDPIWDLDPTDVVTNL